MSIGPSLLAQLFNKVCHFRDIVYSTAHDSPQLLVPLVSPFQTSIQFWVEPFEKRCKNDLRSVPISISRVWKPQKWIASPGLTLRIHKTISPTNSAAQFARPPFTELNLEIQKGVIVFQSKARQLRCMRTRSEWEMSISPSLLAQLDSATGNWTKKTGSNFSGWI